jgi:hypothetical protein
MVLIGGAEELAAIQWEKSFQNSPNNTFTLKTATAMFAKTLLDTKHSMWFTPESQTELKL